MDLKKKALFFLILFLFCIFTSYNLYSYTYYTQINKIETGLNVEFEELRAMTNDTQVLEKINQIENYAKFQQMLLLGGEENVIFYE